MFYHLPLLRVTGGWFAPPPGARKSSTHVAISSRLVSTAWSTAGASSLTRNIRTERQSSSPVIRNFRRRFPNRTHPDATAMPTFRWFSRTERAGNRVYRVQVLFVDRFSLSYFVRVLSVVFYVLAARIFAGMLRPTILALCCCEKYKNEAKVLKQNPELEYDQEII